MKESQYQHHVIERIKRQFQGAVVLKNDPGYIQGMPDLTIFYRDRWAMLECKRSAVSHHQPNQDYYVEQMNAMSYSAFIYPENEEEVFCEMARAFGLAG